MVRLATSGIRVSGVTSFFASLIGLASFFSGRARIASSRSIEKPIHSFFSLTYAKGIDSPRVPAVRTPVRLIFSRTVSACTGTAAPSSRTPANHAAAHRFIGDPFVASPLTGSPGPPA